MKNFFCFLSVTLCLILPISGFAIPQGVEGDPKDSFPLPDGTKAMIFYYKDLSATSHYTNGEVDNWNDSANLRIGVLRYAQWNNLFGPFSYNLNLIVPFGRQEVETNSGASHPVTTFSERASGLADPILNLAFYMPFWGGSTPFGPMGASHFATFNVSFCISPPLGEYHENKLINMGENRWAYTQKLALALRLKNLWLSAGFDYSWFSDNDDFTLGGNMNRVPLKRDKLLTYTGHIAYDLTKEWDVELSVTHANGGDYRFDRTQLGGSSDSVFIANPKSTSVKVGMGVLTGKNTHLLIQYRQDIQNENGYRISGLQGRFAYFF